ncbi:MAG: phage tail sheath subtilisin-like domain-containing protein [Paludibacteraceae bacterium]|nr:phage tail sheath subtilisin-like domain-containing protein [Paludibacteraceae bacterium]
MAQYKTPGVYVEEISKFPPSVASVATAIPAFIGYTEKIPEDVNSQTPVRISSLLDYESLFGCGPKYKVENNIIKNKGFVLYYSLRLFYDNGGGVCYIVSVGSYNDSSNEEAYKKAIDSLTKVDEVTLLLFPDAATLLDSTSPELLSNVQQYALSHCAKMKDRFAILDVKDVDNFRNGVSKDLSYGAAYYPNIIASYSKDFEFEDVINMMSDENRPIEDIYKYDKVYSDDPKDLIKTVSELKDKIAAEKEAFDVLSKKDWKSLSDKDLEKIENLKEYEDLDSDFLNSFKVQNYADTVSLEQKKSFVILLAKQIELDENEYSVSSFKLETKLKNYTIKLTNNGELLAELKSNDSDFCLKINALISRIPNYKKMVAKMQREVNTLPPSAAIAGVICSIDRSKGVWQAPANIGLSSVSDVSDVIDDEEQKVLNVDPVAGKSINAIRKFSGKGILVWGARTLDGYSNEWRYVPVRRLFCYIEEIVQKSTNWAVFQPNTANTWVMVKSQIENFLYNLWRDGAFAGATAEQAYYVKIGKGLTMTEDDINNGSMIVEIGLAAVRPAEFIVLKFSHKVQE